MKKSLFLIVLAASSLALNAQDIIVRKGGEIENVKVLEVSPTEVKFKKSNNPDSPIFVESLSNLYSIKYQNGEVQTFEDSYRQSNNNANYYSGYSKEKKLTHEADLFIGAGWGVGYQLRKEFNQYVGWNIAGISYMSDFSNPKDVGLIYFKLLGVRGYTPSYKRIRGYAELNLGYSLEYDYGDCYHYFGINFGTGIQVHKNFSFGFETMFFSPYSWGLIGAKLSVLL